MHIRVNVTFYNNRIYLSKDLLAKSSSSQSIRDFLTLLSVCHTVIPERDKQDKIIYHASSPGSYRII